MHLVLERFDMNDASADMTIELNAFQYFDANVRSRHVA